MKIGVGRYAEVDGFFSYATPRNVEEFKYNSICPNSNTFARTLARKCCEGGILAGLGGAPGRHDVIHRRLVRNRRRG